MKKIITSIVIMIIVVLGLATNSHAVTDRDLATMALNPDWWLSINPGDYFGQIVEEKGSQSMRTSYCAQKDHTGLAGSTKYLSNIFDIDVGNSNRPGTVTSHGYRTSNSASTWGARNAVELGYLSELTANQGSRKLILQYRLFETSSQIRNDMGLDGHIEGPDGVYNIGQLPPSNQQVAANAANYAARTADYRFEDRSTKDAQTIEVVNGKTYIGPYKIETADGTITKARVQTQAGAQYETTQFSYSVGGGTSHLNNIGSWNDFYLVFDGEVDSAEQVKIYKKFYTCRARIMILSGQGMSQSMIVYGGKWEDKEFELGLPKVPFSNIKIKKTDEGSGKGLPNVGFIAYNETEKKWVQDGVPVKYVADKSQATVYKTNGSGQVTIRNLNKKGKYTIYEVANPNFGFADANTEKPSQIVQANIAAVGQTISLNIKNPRIYVKLSGYVWEDMIYGKQSSRNELWKNNAEDSKDQRVNNITVLLKKADGTILDSRTTKSIQNSKGELEEGAYLFGDYQRDPTAKKILIEDLKDAYIEFTYNGMSYQSAAVKTLVDNGNKATDSHLREEFNNNYATVVKGNAQNPNGEKTYDLNYSYNNHISTLQYGGEYIYGYKGQKYPVTGVSKQYTLTADTKHAAPSNFLGQKYSMDDLYKQGLEEIPNINLGLVEREMPDLAVVQDVQKAKVTLNGYEHTYQYDQRFDNPDGFEGGSGFNVAVKFGNKYGSNSYTREMYPSDMIYNEQEANNGKLQVYLTYKVAIRNESTNIRTKVNSFANYFDERYDIVSIGDKVDVNNIKYNVDENYKEQGYKKVTIDANQNVAPQTQNYIYIQYQLKNEAVNSVLKGEVTLSSISEITSYSSYSDSNFAKRYGSIDKDSEPNTIQIGNKDSYEDDTDQAPAFILKTKENREVKGTIWEDTAIQELLDKTGYDKERKGDGLYNKNENIVENVKVELLTPKVDQTGQIVLDENKNPTYEVAKLYQKDQPVAEATMDTEKDGNYSFQGMIPANYVLRYTYGNESVICDPSGNEKETIEARHYKSTNYRGGDKTAADKMTDYWYRSETGEKGIRWSDAKDETGVYQDGTTFQVVERRTTTEDINYQDATKDNEIEAIQSNTRKFDLKLDYDVGLDNISKYGEELKFIFDNMDFGIIRRPKQELIVTKEISHIEVVLANGQVVISGDPRDGSIEIPHLKFLPDGNVYIEIDSEIIQGATLKVEYEIKVDNTKCEVDYNNLDYYYYGMTPKDHKGWKIATVKTLFDYPNNGLSFDDTDDKNKEWEDLKITEDLVKDGFLSQESFDIFKKYAKTLQTSYFADMQPGQVKMTTMALTRLLSNNEVDFTFENDIEVNVPNGRVPDESTPGNFVPGTNEPDNDGKIIIITGPTGETSYLTLYIILGISMCIILGAGVIFIKKKMIK